MSARDGLLARLGRVVDALLPRYGLSTVGRTLLQHENNAVYRVVIASGESFVVRVAPSTGRTEQEQRSEMQWLEALRRETSMSVPEPVRNLDGDLVTTITPDGEIESHPCVILRWVPGEPPEPGLAPTLIEQIGVFTAEMHRCSDRFSPEAGFTRPRWDWDRLFGSRSILHDEPIMTTLDPRQRVILDTASARIYQALSRPDQPALRQGLIHADLHLDNILIDHSEVRVIDFDDCGSGYHLYDLASILDSFNRRIFANPLERLQGREALLRGYARVQPLPPNLDEYLGIFIAFRTMVTLDFILRSKNPDVQEWGPPRVAPLIDQLRAHLDGEPRPGA